MSSYLKNQLNAFQSDVSSTASKLSHRRGLSGQNFSSTPGTPSSSAGDKSNELKRKRPEQLAHVVYSQPQDTGTGRHLMTQVTYAVEYLKSKEKSVTFKDIFDYLSIQDIDEQGTRTLQHILTRHEKVEYDKTGAGGKGTFRFRPTHNVRSGEQLLAYLQQQPTAQGIPVKELKDGWPGAVDAIDTLESEHRLLVTRNRKDSTPRMVWLDDPSFSQDVDEEFKLLWRSLKVPSAGNDLREELKRFGLAPTSQMKDVKVSVRKDERKKKKAKSGGRTTNSHMAGILKDYTHLRRA